VSDLLDAEPESSGDETDVPRGDIDFEDVTFTYPEADEPALRGLSLRIPEGRTVALVGPSGAGKSTVTRLISRFFDPDDGRIALAGRDLRAFDLDALRESIAIVPQDPTLFSGSVRDNIRYARPEADDAAVEHAAQIAHADGFINELSQSYDTEIGERGTKLSGGQKQRIAIARAVLKDAQVLILDEATASLDSESEAIIQDALEGAFAQQSDLTTIIIAHRLSTIQDADMIHCLEDGQLVESGSHDELLAQGGLYARLHELQFRSETNVL
jgi:subfamily B ATP-binding cassette protein MsbA